jgi:hypothetical protein
MEDAVWAYFRNEVTERAICFVATSAAHFSFGIRNGNVIHALFNVARCARLFLRTQRPTSQATISMSTIYLTSFCRVDAV